MIPNIRTTFSFNPQIEENEITFEEIFQIIA